ncbi:MAG: hypothetical protein ACYTER_10090 [Planctomycetota bacterium]
MENAIEAGFQKVHTGKIGSGLSLLGIVGFCLTFPWMLTPLMIFILPTWLLIIFVSSIFCIHRLLRKRNDKFAIAALSLNFILVIFLPIIFITFTHPGVLPFQLRVYKFKRALECDFWLNYDKKHIIDVQSQNTFILSKQGAIRFKSEIDTYQKDPVIKYAEDNGWKYHLSVNLTKEDFEKYDKNSDEDIQSYAIDYLSYSPILLKNNCMVLIFETGHIHGMPSYIMISDDSSEMVIFFYNARLPDPAMKFEVPEPFKELSIN